MFDSVMAILGAPLITNGSAGIPTKVDVTCPVGGEKFVITGTASCSRMGDRTLSLRPISSCDFITRLPQCPSNGLPMYRDFTPGEVAQLEAWLKTDEFASIRSKSRFYVAYRTERLLSPTSDPFISFEQLLIGVWYDPSNTLNDAEFMDAYFKAGTAFLAKPGDIDAAFIKLIMAYPAMYSAKSQLAEDYIAGAEAEGFWENEVLGQWALLMRECLADYDEDKCDPETRIDRP
ncbi:hypothetical protein [Parvularcula marina]|uniref:Uncharacterized protein n=1 Tax=Parvularcula marina TaxID=2292771 RepID=A0A371REF7_9PROT|nr:hypothetical protein [Parvularcula marina]RFB03823.1 hypothetical protein DX908_00115 [Parvularcula marina]